MTVSELIEELKLLGTPDAEVHIAYNYGDHWRTTVAPKVQRVQEECVAHSDYHSMPMVIDEDDKRYDENRVAVVLS